MNVTAVSRTQRGTVLITALVFMVVLTLVAVVAMRTTTLDLKITTNTMLKARAFENSESARIQMVDVLDQHVFNRGWPTTIGGSVPASAAFTIPSGMTITGSPSAPRQLYLSNNKDIGDAGFYDAGEEDATYLIDGNSDGDYTDATDVNADVYITRLVPVQGTGTSAAMVSGYEGLGKGTAGGGGFLFFDARSRGASSDNTTALTGSDIRIVIRN